MTTPHQGAPDGAVTVGGGEWRYGQLVNEKSARAAFEFDSPSNLSEALELLPVVLSTLPNDAMKPFQKMMSKTDEERKNGTVLQSLIDSLGERPVKTTINNIITNIHNAIVGGGGGVGTGDEPTVFDNIKTVVDNVKEAADTLQGITAPGNQVLSPNFELPSIKRLGLNTPGITYTTAQHMLGTHSLQITTTAGSQGLYLAPSQTNSIYTIQPGDMFNVACKVRAHASNGSTGNMRLIMRWLDGSTTLSDVTGTVKNNSATDWKSAFVDFEAVGTAPANADGLQVFLITDSTTPAGYIYYVDAAYVREKTVAQKIIDNIHAALDPAPGTQQKPETVADKLKAAWAVFVDGLKGRTAGTTTAALPADVYTAAAEVNSTAETAQTTADTATDIATDVTNTVLVQARDYTNIAGGSDFETKDSTGNWIHPWDFSSSRWSVSTAHFDGRQPSHTGTNGAAMAAMFGSTPTVAKLKAQPTAQEGEQFYIEFWAMCDSYYNGTDALSRLRVGYNDTDIFLDSIPFGSSHLTPYVWTFFSKTITVNAGTKFLNFSVSANHTATNSSNVSVTGPLGTYTISPNGMGKVTIDEITIRRVIPPDGIEPLPKSHVNDLEFNLSALASYRGANMLNNGGFELPLTRIHDYGPGGDPATRYLDIGPGTGCTYDTTHVKTGATALKMATTGGTAASLVWPQDPLNGETQQKIPCTTSDVYYVEAWVYGKSTNTYSGAQGFTLNVTYYDASGTALTGGSAGGPVTSNVTTACNGTWTLVSGYFNGGAGASSFTVGPLAQGPNGNEWWVDGGALYRVTEAYHAQQSADWAAGDIQTTVDNIHQAVNGGASTGNSLASVKTNINTVSAAATTATNNVSTLTDHVTNSFLGESTLSGTALSDAKAAMQKTYVDLQNNTKTLQSLLTKKNYTAAKGTLFNVDFSNFSTMSAAGFTVTYSGSGTSTIGISNGVAQWVSTNNADRDAKIIYNTATNTDFQILRGTMSAPPQNGGTTGKPKFHAIGRVNSAGTSFVWARAYCDGFLSYKAEIGCTVSGTETVWASNIPLTWSLDMTFVVGVGTNARQYQVWSGNTLVYQYTESGTTSQLGASYRQWGSIAQIRGGTGGPFQAGKVAGCSVADNQLPTFNGTIGHMTRTGTGTVNLTGGSSDTALPSSFWSTVVAETPDCDGDSTNGTFTVTNAGPYIIKGRVRLSANVASICRLNLQRYTGGSWSMVQCGDTVYPSAGGAGQSLSGTWIQYLNAGDKVQLSTWLSGITAGVLTGESSGTETYFSITAAPNGD